LNLANLNLTDADLTDARLIGADLADATLIGADLTRAFLMGADLAEAGLYAARLTDALVVGADLTKADLAEADLTGAILTEADLIRARHDRADLTEKELLRALFPSREQISQKLTDLTKTPADLTEADLTGAVWSAGAQVPDGWRWRRDNSGRLEPDDGDSGSAATDSSVRRARAASAVRRHDEREAPAAMTGRRERLPNSAQRRHASEPGLAGTARSLSRPALAAVVTYLRRIAEKLQPSSADGAKPLNLSDPHAKSDRHREAVPSVIRPPARRAQSRQDSP
jgi:hypothetical protein